MKQTAVEWLLENLNSEPYSEEEFNYNSDCWDKAKAMEKEQIIEAFNQSWHDRMNPYKTAEKYYKETYESNTCLLNDGCDGIRCYNCINNQNI